MPNNFMNASDAVEVLTPYAASIKNLKITALNETSPATSAHEVGTYLTYNNVIYSVKTAIAVGDTLTVDTNIEVADIPEGAVVYWEDDSSPSGQVQSDWNQTDNTQPDYIKNKPSDDVVTLNGNPLSFTTDSEQAARECVITFEPIQAGSGDPSPSNVRVISGYDKAELKATGKNIFNGTFNKAYIEQGTTYKDNSSCRTAVVPVQGNTDYSISKNGGTRFIVSESSVYPTNNSSCTLLYDSGSASSTGSCSVHASNNAKYILVYVTNDDTDNIQVQVELGSTATAYEPYNPITDYSEPLPETVYGGTLNVETGELVVDSIKKTDWTGQWYLSSSAEIPSGRAVFWYSYQVGKDVGLENSKPAGNDDNINNIKMYCNKSDMSLSYNQILRKNEFAIGIGGNSLISTVCFNVSTSEASTLSEFATWIASQSIEIVYPLATPYSIHLTPAQVQLLQGNNVVTTNGTSIKLTYRNGELATLADVSSVAESVNALGEKVEEVNAAFKKVVYVAQSSELIAAGESKDYDISDVIPSGYIPISVMASQYLSAANAVIVGVPFRKTNNKWYIQVYNWYSQALSMQPKFYILCTTWE